MARGIHHATLSGRPLPHPQSGYVEVMALAVAEGTRAYLPMEADGGGAGGKL